VGTGDAGPRSDVYGVGVLAYELLTGDTPFKGDNALSVAYQRMDNDVPPPSAAIAGVPTQFDELVLCATARNPADRYADAQDMGAELEAIVEELGLPPFRVPAPRNSAQHAAAQQASVQASARAEPTTEATTQPPRQHTREFTRDDWPEPPPTDEIGVDDSRHDPDRFAGIEIDEFEWARQRARRATLFWVIAVLTLAGLVAVGAWTLGSNLDGLL
jgi:serine/threonine-protein kinase